jgi:carboxylesterase
MMTSVPTTILPGADPIFHRGGALGVLGLHGFTACPAEVRWLAADLVGRGCTVYAPRLPGHGTDPRDMSRARWQDWYAATLDGYHLLRQQCERVVVAGHSMGAMLALLTAAHVPADAVVALAAPVMFTSRSMQFARWLKYVLPYTDQTDRSTLPEIIRAEQARRGEPVIGRVRYDRWSTAAVAELYTLAEVVRAALPGIRAPLLLIYSEADETVPLDNLHLILKTVSSPTVEHHILSRSGHILPQDIEREQVFAWVGDFVARLSTSAQPAAAAQV